eukprot:1992295-Amphidinium_carterae.1
MSGATPNLAAQCRNIRRRIPQTLTVDVEYTSGLMVPGRSSIGTRVLMGCIIGTEFDPRVKVLGEDKAKFKAVTKLPEQLWNELTAVLQSVPPSQDLGIAIASLHLPALEMGLEGCTTTKSEFKTLIMARLSDSEKAVYARCARENATVMTADQPERHCRLSQHSGVYLPMRFHLGRDLTNSCLHQRRLSHQWLLLFQKHHPHNPRPPRTFTELACSTAAYSAVDSV